MKILLRRGVAIACSSLVFAGALPRIVAATTTPAASIAGTVAPTSPTAQPSVHVSTSYTLSPDQFSLTISPTRLVIGSSDLTKTQEILVINRGQAQATVVVGKRNFNTSIDGSLNYQQDAPFAAADWIVVNPNTFTIPSGGTQTVTATVKVPKDPDSGDHQVALVFLVAAGKTGGNIKINRGVAAPVFITVPGAIDDSATLSDLHAPAFATSGPITVTAKIHNIGTVHRDFRGKSPLTLLAAGAHTAFPDFTVSRGAVRDISASWDPPFMCICHPSVQFVNEKGAVQIETIRVIIFPWPTFAIGIVGLILLFLLIKLARRGYRKSIVKAATAMNRGVSSGDA